MTTHVRRRFGMVLAAFAAVLSVGVPDARGQCAAELTSGLRFPLGIAQSNKGNLIVSESGERAAQHQGRISILGLDGSRRTLIDGLPSAINDAGDPSGPAGVIMQGRTLYVAIGIGDSILPVGTSPVRIGNPAPSSRIFSSVLAMHFSANVELNTLGFSLGVADHEALADGQKVTLSNGDGDKMSVELIVNFPDYVANPLPTAPANVQGSNPFDLALLGDQLYVTDGGRNRVWRTDLVSGTFDTLAIFAAIANPLFPGIGGPTIEPVPTGIREFNGQLFVTLFRGFPFVAGTSVVEQIDPETGAHAPILNGLRTAIDVLPSSDDGENISLLVLQHASGPVLPPFSGPGMLTRIDGLGTTVLANCLNRPTSMVRDDRSGAIYLTELVNGRVVVVQ